MISAGYLSQFLNGLWVTLQTALSALLLGLILGLLAAIAKISKKRWLVRSITLMTNTIRGLPELLILFIIYYGSTFILSKLFNSYIEISPFTAGVVSLGLIFGAYASETIRGAYIAIPIGQWEASNAFGFNHVTGFCRIILPQLWLHALPGLGNLWFVLLKDTALVALIGLPDIMRVAQNTSAATQEPFQAYTLAALLYLLLTSLSMLGQRQIEKQLSLHLQETH